jgi:hypothetical protein
MRVRARIALSLLGLAACVLTVGFSAASFTDTVQNPQTVSAIADWLGPSASASAIAKTPGSVAGYVREGGSYFVYANVADSGNPASGVASVAANVSSITTGQTAVPLIAGSYSAGGVSYGYRSAELKAKASLSAGTKAYTLTMEDAAKNKTEDQSFSVVVGNGPFRGSSFETDNASGGEEGKPEKGDSVSFTFNEVVDPSSIVSGWTGSGTKSVTVSIANGGENDSLSVSGATIGSIALKGDFTDGTATFSSSTISVSGATVTIVLGAASGSIKTDTDKSKAVWTPSGSNYDRAGNACSTSTVTGGNQKQF